MANNTTEKPGCLSIFLPFLRRSESKSTPETLPYRLRDDFLSPAEYSFYKVLSSILGTRFAIQSKVRLADIFFVVQPNQNIAYFNKIVQRHLDFLICDAATMKPLLGIELDDSSHQWNQRQERDKFIEEVFEAAQFPLLRFPVQREYNAREIVARLAPALKNKLESSPPSPQLHTSSERNAAPPLCPKCGVPMVLRTVTQGEHKGKQFYGCPNFPKCREVKPASDSAPS